MQEPEKREKLASSKMKEKKEMTTTTHSVIPTVIDSGSDTEVSDDASHDDVAAGPPTEFELDIGNLSCVICK